MDYGHAHPSHNQSPLALPNDDPNHQQTPRRPLSFLNVSKSSSTLRRSPQTALDSPLTLPQRRLQLRKAGFRAPQLPSHCLSTRISRWFAEKDDDHTHRHRKVPPSWETSPPTVRRRNPRDIHPPGSILREITNSTRSRQSENRTSASIYEEGQDSSPTLSWYHDAPSTQQSPVAFGILGEKNDEEMKLREISGNAQRSSPPLSSPLARQIRGRSKRSLNLRKTSFPASEHIVFLENKLEEVEKSQYSPNSGMPLKDKIRALANENNRLQETLGGLEHQFENRLMESVEHKTGMEVSLRRKIKQLEEEIRLKDSQIRDLEYRNDNSLRDLSNAESYKAAVEQLESEKRALEESNRSLEKRNDVLAELLGHSPTRSHHGFELPSPVRGRNTRSHHGFELPSPVRGRNTRTPRPKSMMPRLPSSPMRGASSRPQSLHGIPSPFQHDYFSPLSAIRREHDHPCYGGENIDPQKPSDDVQSVDSGLGESCSVRSGDEAMSKRSSMHSYTSAGMAGWGLPPSSPTESAERSSRKRKTRRFASGSTQLKPLVLPTLNATGGVPQSAASGAYATFGRRDVSEQGLDPTISYLSRPCDSPIQAGRGSMTWSAEDALQALEGNQAFRYVSFEEALSNQEASQSLSDQLLTFPDSGNQLNHDYPCARFSPNLVDDVIMEEEGRAYLNEGVEDAGDQSFSSMIGQLSITDSDLDRLCVGDQTLMATFPEAELPQSASVELPLSFQPGPAVDELAVGDLSQVNQVDQEVLLECTFSGEMAHEPEMANPLAAPYPPPDSTFQQNTTPSSADCGTHSVCEHRFPLAWGSLTLDLGERSTEISQPSTGIGVPTAEPVMPNPLKALASHPTRPRPPSRRPSPPEVLQRKASPIQPLTSVSNRTIFGTISRYSSYIREIRRDPTALARRVIANAWCSHWKRFGSLSWWVLGLFLGPGWKRHAEDKRGWEGFDGENIAWEEHERVKGAAGPGVCRESGRRMSSRLTTPIPQRSSQAAAKRAEFPGDSAPSRKSQRHEAKRGNHLRRRDQEQKAQLTWRKSLYLWGKFSVAILLAVGGAVVNGPGEMLKDCELHRGDGSEMGSDDYVDDRHDADADATLTVPDTVPNHPLHQPKENTGHDATATRTTKPAPHSTITTTTTTEQRDRNRPSVNSHPHPPTPPPPSSDHHHHQPHHPYTFGAPPIHDYDCHDDNGQSRPSRSRVRFTTTTEPSEPSEPAFLQERNQVGVVDSADRGGGRGRDLGTLQWMRNLSVEDFDRVEVVEAVEAVAGGGGGGYGYGDDGERTVRAKKRSGRGGRGVLCSIRGGVEGGL